MRHLQITAGIVLLAVGILFSKMHSRPWIDFDFHLTWFGFLLLYDFLAGYLSNKSIFSDLRNFLLLAFSSSFFWWFFEWLNLSLKNWDYPTRNLYSQTEWGFLATIAFITVISHLVISTNLVEGIFKPSYKFVAGTISKHFACFLILTGLLMIGACILFPLYAFPLAWVALFLIFDPLNAMQDRESLVVQFIKGNYKPIFILAVSAVAAGIIWETLNFIVPKWTYPIVPWFWSLPAPITTKYVEMPLAGFLGYIPFIFSAFSFVKFLGIKVSWLNPKT